jgi:hypothetical protein
VRTANEAYFRKYEAYFRKYKVRRRQAPFVPVPVRGVTKELELAINPP